jgi:hypothetical protein
MKKQLLKMSYTVTMEIITLLAFRTSSTHYKDPAVYVRKSQDCGNTITSMHQSSQKGKWNDAPMAALTSLISGCDTF